MEWGSSFVYDYRERGDSEEESLSEGEMAEGMWLSDSDEDDEFVPPPPVTLDNSSSNLSTIAQPPSSIKEDSGEDDDDDDDEQEEEVPPSQIDPSSGYTDVLLPPAAAAVVRSDVSEGSPAKYIQLKALQQEIRERAEPQQQVKPKANSSVPVIKLQKPTLKTNSEPTPPPAPPPPTVPIKQLHGIMKGEVKKLKKQRVHWDKSYRSKNSQGIKTRKADTNILGVKFNTLREASTLHTGDAQFCSNTNCGAVVSHLTKLVGEETDDNKVWMCEFCGTSNGLDIVAEEIPTKEDTTYLITPAAALVTEGMGPVKMDESLVVFCIDTSGSMCVTTKVPGHYDLRGAKEKHDKMMKSLPSELAAELRRPEYQYMHRQTNVTWISRMESLQAAIDSQLAHLVHSEPNKRICLVTFSDDVTIIGDGRMNPVTIAGDKLSNTQAIIDVGREVVLPASIRETQKALSKKVFSMEESGQTALGPAALVSVVIASQKPGSKVVICTDGLANIGLGSLEVSAADTKAYAAAENFYEDLGDIAMDKGVTVSLLSIKGADCRVVELGQIANRTGGQVTLVDPLTVTDEFGSILNNPIIATDVVAKIVLHRGLYFRDEESKDSVIMKQVGNVTADTELTYEYGVRTPKKKITDKKDNTGGADDGDVVKSKEDVAGATGGATGGAAADVGDVPPQMVNGKPHLPFQLQLEYTNSDGDRCLRVITQTKPVTQDRKIAEKGMDTGIIGSHVAKKTAELTMQGEYTQARVKSLATQRMLQENSRTSATKRWEYTNFCNQMIPLENELMRIQHTERSSGRNYSDDEDDEEFYRGSDLMSTSYSEPVRKQFHTQSAPLPPSRTKRNPFKLVRKSKESHRRQEMSDDLAYGLYGLTETSSKSFRSPQVSTQSNNDSVRDDLNDVYDMNDIYDDINDGGDHNNDDDKNKDDDKKDS